MNYKKYMVSKNLPERILDSHKGTYGSVLIIGGSENFSGAPILAGMASLKIGAGLCSLCGIESVISGGKSLAPELTCITLPEKKGCISGGISTLRKIIDKYSVIIIGCGLGSIFGKSRKLEKLLEELILLCKVKNKVIILDADGLNYMADNKKIRENLPSQTILTPHPKELARLMNVTVKNIQENREKFAIVASEKFGAYVVLKGNKTLITDGKSVIKNTSGNSSLAKAGSGDVLAGIIAGICSQALGHKKEINVELIATAVYLHGRAGELASEDMTEYGVLARDIIPYLSKAISE